MKLYKLLLFLIGYPLIAMDSAIVFKKTFFENPQEGAHLLNAGATYYDEEGNNILLILCKEGKFKRSYINYLFPHFISLLDEVNYAGQNALMILAQRDDTLAILLLFETILDYYKCYTHDNLILDRARLMAYHKFKQLIDMKDKHLRDIEYYSKSMHIYFLIMHTRLYNYF